MLRRHVLKDLSSYLDNQLSEKEKLRIEQHLSVCATCSQELSRLKVLSERLKTWQAPDLGPEFESALRNKIVLGELEGSVVTMKKKTAVILIPSGVLAGILLILLVGHMYTRSHTIGGLAGYRGNIEEDYAVPGTRTWGVHKGDTKQGFAGGRFSMQADGRSTLGGTWGMDEVHTGGVSHGGFTDSAAVEGEQSTPPYPAGSHMERGAVAPYYAGTPEGSVIVIQPVLPATGEGEKIIRTATIRLEVADGNESYQKASLICKELKGYLASSRFYKDAEGRESGTITMRIPKDNFLIAMEKLGALGNIEDSSSESQDVGQEYANLKARLDATMVVYTKTLEALQKRQTTIPEAMRLESELTPILQRIEELKNRIEYLNNAVSFTTVTLNFHEPAVSAKVLKESKRYFQENLLAATIKAVKFSAQAIPAFIVIAIWLVLIVGIAFLVKYFIVRLFKRG